MHIVFNKIPRLAKWFYGCGFSLLLLAMVIFFYFPTLIAIARLQQLFIGGAIIVAVGSVINTLHQFKPNHAKNNHQKDSINVKR